MQECRTTGVHAADLIQPQLPSIQNTPTSWQLLPSQKILPSSCTRLKDSLQQKRTVLLPAWCTEMNWEKSSKHQRWVKHRAAGMYGSFSASVSFSHALANRTLPRRIILKRYDMVEKTQLLQALDAKWCRSTTFIKHPIRHSHQYHLHVPRPFNLTAFFGALRISLESNAIRKWIISQESRV